MNKKIQLIVGLGNPGKQYETTRHNIGFRVIDCIVDRLHLDQPQKTTQYHLWIWPESTTNTKVLFVEPRTFMNKSGEAVSELVRFFKISDDDIMVIQDDIDLEFGAMRLRQGGGSGGHNGIASIQEELGFDHFKRLKLGIGRPPEALPADAYVLQPFNEDERGIVQKMVDQAADIVVKLASNETAFEDKTIKVS